MAERQYGLITKDQARRAGLSDASIDVLLRRHWRRVAPRVYAVGEPADPARRAISAASLWLPDAVVAGCAAGLLHCIWDGDLTEVDLIIGPLRRLDPRPGFRLHRMTIDAAQQTRIGPIRVLTATATCLDLARRGVDVTPAALRRRLTAPDRLATDWAAGHGRHGQGPAGAIVASAQSNPWSGAEADAHRVLRGGAITGWVANAPVQLGGHVVHPDIAVLELRLAIEIEGRAYHDEAVDPDAFEHDRQREARLRAAGWEVLRFSAKQLRTEPDLVLATVRATIDRLRRDAA